MPPEVVAKILRPAVHFPFPQDIKGEVIEQKDAAGPVSIGSSQGADVDAFRAAMDRMRARVPRARKAR
jgi:hypothetical protein